ncbi:restriction endonuclease subunit S [Pseudomonas umsongensis]|jgi:type I restriction enzyme S subunit|uniref:restriction endonuclease subunit S n=1 Tax=Pseudomonas umsongensis TaxID=198618 RepID=UPI0015C11E4D|nr:restriction endonuclease subunit S [Pseudomonas umsongensis]NWL17784.1 type I restriction endonuclease subunit R [Pseudomonas umsongensis]
MDAQQFLAEFGHIASAPGGVQQLREMIYQLAITGALTPQIEAEGDACTLLVDIAASRERLINKKAYKRLRKLESEALDIPVHVGIPASWCWTRLLDIGEISPRNDAPDEALASFIPMSGFSQLHMGQLAPEANKWGSIKKGFTHFANGDVVVAKITPCFENGKAAVIVGLEHYIGAGTTELHVFRPIHAGVLSGYVYLFLRSPYFAIEGEKNMTGTAGQKRLPTEYFATRAMPLPPTGEQSRIVAKVDELMALCDKLEAQQQARRKLQNNLRQSILQAVANATSPHDLQSTWARLTDNFGRLFHAPEDVDDLRKAVRDLAVSGYLSNPDKVDEPALALKAKILAAKERGTADGSFSRKKQVKPERLEETTLPAHWESITLDDAISTIDAGWSPACLPGARDDESKWGVLKTTAVQVLRFLPHEHKELPASLDPRPQYQIEVGDILITRAGPKNRVGICCVVDSAPSRLMISDKIIRFHIVDDLINPRFVALCLSAGEPGRIVERLKSGMADSQMNISQDKLRSLTIPIPPIEEQQRILTKVEAFMKVVDIYSERLQKGGRLAGQVAATAVSALTGIAIEQAEVPMKAPQTELIASLRLGSAPDIKALAPLATILARHNGEMSAKDLWQRFGGEIDAFYAQLKTEVAHGWVLEPSVAEIREKQPDSVSV